MIHDSTRETLEKRLYSMIRRLDDLRKADREQGPTFSSGTFSYESTVDGFSDAVQALRVMTVEQVRESVHRLEQCAENDALLVHPSWAYCRGASAAVIMAAKMENEHA